jgi:type IV pilus assembly protein PilO
MPNLNDLTEKQQWLAVVAIAGLLSLGAFFGVYRGMRTSNAADQEKLTAKVAENNELQAYRPKLMQIEQQIENLKLQLAIQRRIVPDGKEADQFIHMLQGEASKAGVEIRAYIAKPANTREFYTEAPFQMEMDGPYYSMLNFFDRVAHLERIINVAELQMATVKKPSDAKVKHTYEYAAGESIVVSCVTTTFFSHDQGGPLQTAKGSAIRPVSATVPAR